MKDQNSYVEFILGTYEALLVDSASQYPGLTKEFNRDLVRLRSAVNCHGIRFALDTMPAYRKHLDQCLAKRRLTHSGLIHFGAIKKGGTIPRLFRGLFLRVFDHTGALRHSPDHNAIRLLRQLLGVVRKLKMASSVKDTGNAVRDFFRTDLEVRHGDLNWSDHDRFEAERASQLSFRDVEKHSVSGETPDLFGNTPNSRLPLELFETVQRVADLISSQLGVFDPMAWKPRHGPGAVSERRFGSYKYDFDQWPDRLETIFPYADFAVANYAQVDYSLTHAEAVARGFTREAPARLCAVPKTLSTPRLIAAEPTALQWCQQTILDYFYKRVSRTGISSFIDFRRQEKNGSLALQASHDAKCATIDLSSASDRISCWHVERLFRRLPCLLRALQATRSTWLEQGICRYSPRYSYLRKYSTMGNATIFPVQSLFFLSLALGATLYQRGLKVNFKNLSELGSRQVRVFGDDLIVPEDSSAVLVELLHALELKVNTKKTFLEGNFRESCGVDAFGGDDVTTVNILEVPRRASPGSIVSNVDVHHNLCEKGYAATARFIQKTAGRIVHDKIRFVKHGSGLFGWSDLFGEVKTNTRVRHNPTLQRGEVRCMRLRVANDRTPAKEAAGLLQFFTEAPSKVTSAVSTLGYLTRRPKIGLSLGWVSVGA